jgi:hypothetical protein
VYVTSSELGLSQPLSLANVPLPPEPRGGEHIRLRLRGWGSSNSCDWRKSLVLCLLCACNHQTSNLGAHRRHLVEPFHHPPPTHGTVPLMLNHPASDYYIPGRCEIIQAMCFFKIKSTHICSTVLVQYRYHPTQEQIVVEPFNPHNSQVTARGITQSWHTSSQVDVTTKLHEEPCNPWTF